MRCPALRPGARAPVAGPEVLVSVCLSVLAACGGPEADPSTALAGLDALAFVPAGECRLLGRDGVEILCENREALLVERYEVSRGAWDAWTPTARVSPPSAASAHLSIWPDALPSWPASGMTLAEARAFAASRGMRLPTAREWIRIAAGTRAQPWPWGLARASSVANTAELGLGHPVPVGAFEQGASPDSIYDLLGNVAEWVEQPLAAPGAGEAEVRPLAWALGGSYATRLWKIYELDREGRVGFVQLDLDPESRALDVGLRCVVEARAWLSANAPDLGATAREREGLRRIGARWGRDAVPLLEELAAAPAAHSSLRWLLEGARG